MKKNDVFWGLLLVLAAALIIVSKLGLMVGVGALQIVLAILLVGIIIKNIIKVSFGGILFPIAFLCILFADQWGITDLTPWTVLLTAFFGSIGLNMIFKGKKFHMHHHGRSWDVNFNNKKNHKENFDSVINEQDGNVINCSVSFGSTIKYINADNFERANIECSFGAMKVYFDNALIQNGNAQINLDVSFAGVELYIPKTWNVVEKVDTSFGAMQEKNRRGDSNAPVVTITGDVSFGGVDILYI